MKTPVTPKISIILPLYNAAPYISQCIESILKQTFSEYELIIVDDASTDESYNIAKRFADDYSQIKLLQNDRNLGVSATMNRAIEQSRGKYIAIMNADDIMNSERLTKQIKFLQENKDHIATGSQIELIDESDKSLGIKHFPIQHEEIYTKLYLTNPVQHSSMLINRALLPNDFSWYNNELRLSEDIDILFRLLNYGKLYNHPDILLMYRVHEQSLTKRNPKEMYKIGYKARKRGKKIHGYKPSLLSSIILEISLILITVLPTQLMLPLFYKVRGFLLKIH